MSVQCGVFLLMLVTDGAAELLLSMSRLSFLVAATLLQQMCCMHVLCCRGCGS